MGAQQPVSWVICRKQSLGASVFPICETGLSSLRFAKASKRVLQKAPQSRDSLVIKIINNLIFSSSWCHLLIITHIAAIAVLGSLSRKPGKTCFCPPFLNFYSTDPPLATQTHNPLQCQKAQNCGTFTSPVPLE